MISYSEPEIGGIYEVVSHDPECETVGAILVEDPEQIRWVRIGSCVLVINVSTGRQISWCNVIFNNELVELSSDLLRPL
jgi:hypothetical protein